MTNKYKRILVKISGESLMGEQKMGHDFTTINRICSDVAEAYNQGLQICLVVGGGNLIRGATIANEGIERASADHMGMLATVINALALQSCLERLGLQTRVLSAVPMMSICEAYIRRRAFRHLEKGRIVIFASGTGNPYFTTDTASALRAVEMNCDALFKATQVDGVYSADPKKDKNAVKYNSLTYRDVIAKDLKVMDTAAIALARENNIPIIVFSVQEPGGLMKVINGNGSFTTVVGE